MGYFIFFIIAIIIIAYIIIWAEKHNRIKKYGRKVEAEVLGYYTKPFYENVLYIVLKFKDEKNNDTIIVKKFSRSSNGVTPIKAYKDGSKIDIKYLRNKEEIRIDKYLDSVKLLGTETEIQPNDDGDLYDIEYITFWNSIESKMFFIFILVIFAIEVIIMVMAILYW